MKMLSIENNKDQIKKIINDECIFENLYIAVAAFEKFDISGDYKAYAIELGCDELGLDDNGIECYAENMMLDADRELNKKGFSLID